MDRTRLTRMFIPALMCMAAATPCAATASAETADDRYILYINTYSQMAVDQQAQFGIPASITLAQGLLESAAGRSTLAREGNNHFGIKCHKGWEGKSMLRDDDAPGECFRVYGSAAESYRDHSLFLSRERYRPLFSHDVTDYASWARGLSRCGYATDPNYASRLIAIIERYALYTYDTRAGREAEEITEFIWQQMRKTHPRAQGARPALRHRVARRHLLLDSEGIPHQEEEAHGAQRRGDRQGARMAGSVSGGKARRSPGRRGLRHGGGRRDDPQRGPSGSG